ncbi:MAG TPA: hypothetical protein VFC84_02230 [Desulfosporosinus sp.]|nr:hypothetical protein [Desulfosporosinus sp.]
MAYTKESIIETLEKCDAKQIYSSKIVNYTGKTSEPENCCDYYTEVIAEYLLKNDLLKSIPMITRITSYKTVSHDKDMNVPTSNRTEEILAIQLYKNCSEVIDYQVPLKNKRDDKAGKIDLLLFADDSLIFGELKIKGSQETLLRAVLEVESYYLTADKAKIIIDYGKTGCSIQKAIIIFKESRQYDDFKNVNMPFIKKLLEKLGIKVYIVEGLTMRRLN